MNYELRGKRGKKRGQSPPITNSIGFEIMQNTSGTPLHVSRIANSKCKALNSIEKALCPESSLGIQND